MNIWETKCQAQLAFEIKLNWHSLLHTLMINVNADQYILDSQTFHPLWVCDVKSQAIFLLESGNIWCFWRWSMWTTIIRVERIIWVDFCTPRLYACHSGTSTQPTGNHETPDFLNWMDYANPQIFTGIRITLFTFLLNFTSCHSCNWTDICENTYTHNDCVRHHAVPATT